VIRPRESGLARESIVNVSRIATIDKITLGGRVGSLPPCTVEEVEDGIRLVLGL